MVYRCTTSYSKASALLFNRLQTSLRNLPKKTLDFVKERLLDELNGYYVPYGLVAELEMEEPALSTLDMAYTKAHNLSDYFDQPGLRAYSDLFNSKIERYIDPIFGGNFLNYSSSSTAIPSGLSIAINQENDGSSLEPAVMQKEPTIVSKIRDSGSDFYDTDQEDDQSSLESAIGLEEPPVVSKITESDSNSYLNWSFDDPSDAWAYTVKVKLLRNKRLTQAIKEKQHTESVVMDTALSPTAQDVAQFVSVLTNNKVPSKTINTKESCVGTIAVRCTNSVLAGLFDLNHVEVSNHALVGLAEENQVNKNDTELLNLCYDCAEAEEELNEALAALPEEQITKKKIALRVLQAVMETGRTYSKCYLPGLIKVLKQTTALVKDNVDTKFAEYKDLTVQKVVEVKNKSHQLIKQYLSLAKELNEQAQPRRLVGALMMFAGVALFAIGAGLGFFTGGLSLLILVTGVPFALISGGAAMYKLADNQLAHEMKGLASNQAATLKKNTKSSPAAPVPNRGKVVQNIHAQAKTRMIGGFKRGP